jgi:hypothetical protein
LSNRASAVSGRDETIARKGNPQVWALGSGLVLRDDGRAKVAQIDGSETAGLDESQHSIALVPWLLFRGVAEVPRTLQSRSEAATDRGPAARQLEGRWLASVPLPGLGVMVAPAVGLSRSRFALRLLSLRSVTAPPSGAVWL